MCKWQPIETAPKDGTRFICKIGNALYAAFYDEHGRFAWVMHSNVEQGSSEHVADNPKYKPQAIMWKKGFDDVPTHWMPLPKIPKEAS